MRRIPSSQRRRDGKSRRLSKKFPFIASFGSFIDETSSLADLILPDHSYLESWIDEVPESGTTEVVVSVAPPAMRPIHDTRAMPDVLLDLAHRLGGRTSQALPWKSYEEMLQAAITPLSHHPGSVSAKGDDEFWKKVQEQGGWWSADSNLAPKVKTQTEFRRSGQKPGPAVRWTGGAISVLFPALRFATVFRWAARESALDAGVAGGSIDWNVGRLGGNQPAYCGSSENRNRRSSRGCFPARQASCPRAIVAGNRAGRHCHAGRTGTRGIWALRQWLAVRTRSRFSRRRSNPPQVCWPGRERG